MSKTREGIYRDKRNQAVEFFESREGVIDPQCEFDEKLSSDIKADDTDGALNKKARWVKLNIK